MRLIDADKFIEDLKEKYPKAYNEMGMEFNAFTDIVCKELENQQTAYDVNKVIDELTKKTIDKY